MIFLYNLYNSSLIENVTRMSMKENAELVQTNFIV
jgi:hypothetical protein